MKLFLMVLVAFTINARADATLNCSYELSAKFINSDGKIVIANSSAENITVKNTYSTKVQTLDLEANPANKYTVEIEAFLLNTKSQYLKLSVIDYLSSGLFGSIIANTSGIFSSEQKEFNSQAIFPGGILKLNCTKK